MSTGDDPEVTRKSGAVPQDEMTRGRPSVDPTAQTAGAETDTAARDRANATAQPATFLTKPLSAQPNGLRDPFAAVRPKLVATWELLQKKAPVAAPDLLVRLESLIAMVDASVNPPPKDVDPVALLTTEITAYHRHMLVTAINTTGKDKSVLFEAGDHLKAAMDLAKAPPLDFGP